MSRIPDPPPAVSVDYIAGCSRSDRNIGIAIFAMFAVMAVVMIVSAKWEAAERFAVRCSDHQGVAYAGTADHFQIFSTGYKFRDVASGSRVWTSAACTAKRIAE